MRKHSLLFVLLLFIGVSCSKEKSSEIKENLVMDIMTAGTWTLDFFTSSTVSVLSEYNGYTFQFYRNGSVDAFKGANVVTGTWYGNQKERSITASFPGVWTIATFQYNLVSLWRYAYICSSPGSCQ